MSEQRPNASEDNGKVTKEENNFKQNFIEDKISCKISFSARFENIYLLVANIDKTVTEKKLKKPLRISDLNNNSNSDKISKNNNNIKSR